MIDFKNMLGNVNYKVFNASGSWTPPAGVRLVNALVVGGGAGAGTASGGSGGEAIITKEPIMLPVGTAITVTVGAGGVGGAPNGTAGTNSSFGDYIIARGGMAGGAGTAPILPAPSPDLVTDLRRVSGAGSSFGTATPATATVGLEFNGNPEDASYNGQGLWGYYGRGLASGPGAANSGQGGGTLRASGGSGVVVVMWNDNNEK